MYELFYPELSLYKGQQSRMPQQCLVLRCSAGWVGMFTWKVKAVGLDVEYETDLNEHFLCAFCNQKLQPDENSVVIVLYGGLSRSKWYNRKMGLETCF